jgi:hypothetical protein
MPDQASRMDAQRILFAKPSSLNFKLRHYPATGGVLTLC